MLLVVAAPASARVALVLLPQGTSVEEVAAAGMSPGLMSAGLGQVPAEQTYLDIGQGNRVFDSLYDSELPRAAVPLNRPVVDLALLGRAQSAPAEIEPGLLARTLAGAGRGFEVRDASLPQLRALVAGLRGDDLLIAIERPPPEQGEALAIGVAGAGYDGNLTSGSTRLDGYVLSTDVAPTILERLGVEMPSQMSGEPIRSEGEIDPAAVVALGERMAVISDRRGPVIGLSLLVWILALGIAFGLAGRAVARTAVRIVGLAVVFVPLVLLLGAAIEPGETVEMLLVVLGAPALAALTTALFAGYRALAVASALTLLACAVDVIAGSSLTALSLMGPNPGLGVRFYGIGNELEAPLAVLTVAGTGAALTGFAPRLAPRPAAVAFLAVGVCAAFVFAAGRFGADVGAAIVIPVGAAVAAAVIAARRRRTALLVAAVPFVALALLALGDLVSGADAHLTRSVLDAGGLGDLGDVAERRLRLSANSLLRPLSFVFLPLVALLVALAVARRDRLRAWLVGRPAMRAGMAGAVVATVVGALANDSGALVLEIGAAYLLVFAGFAWAESGSARVVKAGR
ncbi:MAG TPA: hypothetical protein VEW07_09965 [Solirubrobacterales bacterium]|nr:hypothetical protein [Solirubrobacterales bacterium]